MRRDKGDVPQIQGKADTDSKGRGEAEAVRRERKRKAGRNEKGGMARGEPGSAVTQPHMGSPRLSEPSRETG